MEPCQQQQQPQTQQRVVVAVVEEADEGRAALQWAAETFLRAGDLVTLAYVYPSSRSTRKQRARRLKGFQLALAYKDICSRLPEVNVEIVVKEGDQLAAVVALVNEIRAEALVLGLHDQSCLHRMTAENLGTKSLGCRIIAVKQQQPRAYHGFVTIEFTQVETTRLCIPPRKIPYPILPACSWRKPARRKGRTR